MIHTLLPMLLVLAPAQAVDDTKKMPVVTADLVLVGGVVYDGTNRPPRRADVAIRGDRIVGVGTFKTTGATRKIDARRLVVAPGFIDLHNHSDTRLTKKSTRQNLNYLYQGVTTVVTGNCGSGPIDVGDYLKKIDAGAAGTNVAHLLPHGSLRRHVMSRSSQAPDAAQMQRMRQLTEKAMQEGAWGISTGLIYVPGSYAKTDELVSLSRIVAANQGIYVSHIRGEGSVLLESVQEAIEIGRQAELPVHISHFKATGPDSVGMAVRAIQRVRDARKAGLAVTADQYPYVASSTSLAAMVVPSTYRDKESMQAGLKDPEKRKSLEASIARNLRKRGEGKSLVIARFRPEPKWQGQDLATLAAAEKTTATKLVLKIQLAGGAHVVSFGMREADVRQIMVEPFVATASDGSARLPDAETKPHPRSYGCFPRKLGHYSLKEKVLSLHQAIRSASGLPADILKLPRRGYLRAGYYADIVAFDPNTFIDKATFQNPHQYATGVHYLLVNGKLAIDGRKPTKTLGGRALRHEMTMR